MLFQPKTYDEPKEHTFELLVAKRTPNVLEKALKIIAGLLFIILGRVSQQLNP